MNYIDFHCDTIGECFNAKKDLYKNDLHISLEKAAKFDKEEKRDEMRDDLDALINAIKQLKFVKNVERENK